MQNPDFWSCCHCLLIECERRRPSRPNRPLIWLGWALMIALRISVCAPACMASRLNGRWSLTASLFARIGAVWIRENQRLIYERSWAKTIIYNKCRHFLTSGVNAGTIWLIPRIYFSFDLTFQRAPSFFCRWGVGMYGRCSNWINFLWDAAARDKNRWSKLVVGQASWEI